MSIRRLFHAFLRLIGAERTWSVLNGMPVNYSDAGEAYFDFPSTPPGANYLMTPGDGPIRSAIIARFTIETTGEPYFDFHTKPDNHGTAPSAVRIMVQRRNDDWSGVGDMEYYRFWSRGSAQVLGPGTYLISAPLDPENWTSVFGKKGDYAPEMFYAALADPGYICLTFGGGSFYGHGVFVTGGTARLTVHGLAH